MWSVFLKIRLNLKLPTTLSFKFNDNNRVISKKLCPLPSPLSSLISMRKTMCYVDTRTKKPAQNKPTTFRVYQSLMPHCIALRNNSYTFLNFDQSKSKDFGEI